MDPIQLISLLELSRFSLFFFFFFLFFFLFPNRHTRGCTIRWKINVPSYHSSLTKIVRENIKTIQLMVTSLQNQVESNHVWIVMY